MSIKKVPLILFVVLGLMIAGFVAAEDTDTGLKQVEAKKVCMVNNKAFDKDQIAIEVEGKTYYGCCEMCKKTLAANVESRWATDPISGKKVDKAKAIIGAREDGSVEYFENEENLKKFKDASHS